jgi:hypothetical protein
MLERSEEERREPNRRIICAKPIGVRHSPRRSNDASVTSSRASLEAICMTAVCCKPDVSEGGIGVAQLYPAREESICLPLATMDIRAHSISFSARSWKTGWVTRSRMRRRDRSSISSIQLADLGSQLSAIGRSSSRCHAVATRFVVAPLIQDHPSDTRQLVGERSCQHIVMKPFRRGRKATVQSCVLPSLLA